PRGHHLGGAGGGRWQRLPLHDPRPQRGPRMSAPAPVEGERSATIDRVLPRSQTPSRRDEARLVQILLVEDNPADIELTRQALTEGRVANEVHVVGDGE